MSDIVIVKNENGKIEGLGEKAGRAYAKWCNKVRDMEVGETLQFSWRQPRSPKFHRLFFAMLQNLFDQQEQFADLDALRGWLTVGAGYCDFAPGPKGRMVALPKSIAWASMDDNEFHELVSAIWQFLRTVHPQVFLWPHLSEQQRDEVVELLLAGFES